MKKSRIGLLTLWAVISLIVSCSTEKKAQKKTAWLIAHDQLDDICARVYPNKDSIVTKDSIAFDTLYVESDPEISRDTIYKGDTVFISAKCPPQKIITQTIYRDTIRYKTNTAEVDKWKGIADAKDKQIAAKDDIIIKQQVKIDKNDKWRLWFFILAGANILAFVFRFFVIKKPL